MEARNDATWFRQQLIELGHDRLIETIDRAVRRLANGSARASGEMRALIGALRQQRRQG